jgi:predicted MFS family arabinose efflux permease
LFNRVFKAFAYPDFRLMWFGACTSSIGTWMQIAAQSWLVYKLTNSARSLSLDAFYGQAPIFLLSLFGGVFADRVSRRRLLLISQVIQMTCAFTLAYLVRANLLKAGNIWWVYCLSFTVGVAQSFGGPAYSALVPSLVKKEDLQNAIALNSIQFNLARVVGPALGGIVLNISAFWCFALNGLSYVAVIGSLLLIRTKFVPAATRESVITSMKQGIDFMRKREGMLSLIILAFFIMLLSYPLITFLPVIVRTVFHGSSNMFTLFLCISGAGSVTGALLIAGRSSQPGQAKKSLEALLVLGVTISAIGLSRLLPLTTGAIFLAGALLMVVFALNTSLVQAQVADAMRGRVMSVYNVAFRGGMPIGSVICGYLIEKFSASVVLAGNGILVVVLALYFLLIQKKLAKL